MKPALEYLPREPDSSIVVKDFDYKYYPTPWHYHPEYEIVLVTESTGKRFIGDSVSDFEPGNLAMIGSNIPHTYRNEEKYYKGNKKLRAKSIVIHFLDESLGKDFLQLPEASSIKELLINSNRGYEIEGHCRDFVSGKLKEIVQLKGMKRWLCLIDILMEIAETRNKKTISTYSETGYNFKESERIGNVFDWVVSNYEKDIRLSDAARIAQMNENAFSRFFSNRTRKTFTEFVQELRLQKAAKLLLANEMSVTQVCFDCGYNNLSNFNRQFLNHYKMSPLKYRQSFLKQVVV